MGSYLANVYLIDLVLFFFLSQNLFYFLFFFLLLFLCQFSRKRALKLLVNLLLILITNPTLVKLEVRVNVNML